MGPGTGPASTLAGGYAGSASTTSACVPSPEVPPAGVRRVLRAVRAAPAKRGRRSDPEPHSLSRIGRADRRRCPSPFHPVRNISRGDLFGRAVRFVSEPGRPADHRQDEQFHELRLWLQQFRRALRLSASRVVVVGCLACQPASRTPRGGPPGQSLRPLDRPGCSGWLSPFLRSSDSSRRVPQTKAAPGACRTALSRGSVSWRFVPGGWQETLTCSPEVGPFKPRIFSLSMVRPPGSRSIRDIPSREDVVHLRTTGKRGKMRFISAKESVISHLTGLWANSVNPDLSSRCRGRPRALGSR